MEWIEWELQFLKSHQYYTFVAYELYNKSKEKHIRLLRKRELLLNPNAELTLEEQAKLASKDKKKKKKKKPDKLVDGEDLELKQLNLGRGVETMYRTTYRTHVNLSSIADNKANIMLSINAIIISIIVSTMVPRFDTDPKLILPTLILLAVCMVAIIYATLSTRPKITEGKFTREDIEQKRSNLLFFGNFYNMDINDFHWGMMEMIKDSDFLYSSMTRDLYYLGVVLAKKYRYLSICYAVFYVRTYCSGTYFCCGIYNFFNVLYNITSYSRFNVRNFWPPKGILFMTVGARPSWPRGEDISLHTSRPRPRWPRTNCL